MKTAIETLGCRVNTYDSEAMTELFRSDGYSIVPFSEVADVYVINTCTVTNMGDKKSRQLIRRARRLNPEAVICVVGCYSQVAPEEIAGMDEVDIVLGSRNKSRVVELANRSLVTGERFVEVSDIMSSNEFEPLKITDYQDRTRAFLKIQDGCNRFCSYCMIPYARGGISSKDRLQVLEEVRTLAEHGFKEVILSGIHIASYGLDLTTGEGILLSEKGPARFDLLNLLQEVEEIPGIERIRIGSIEPMFFQGAGLERVRTLNKLMPHFHLSLQSGSNTVLKRMNRRYSTEEFQEVVEKLRRAIPGVSITTDLITGFPGETEQEHEETLSFLKRIQLTKTHVFKYSPREGTPAASMAGQIQGEIKDRRSQELIRLSNLNESAFHADSVGKIHRVLFETNERGWQRGFSENYLEILVKSEKSLAGSICKVKILEAETHYCIGEVLGECL